MRTRIRGAAAMTLVWSLGLAGVSQAAELFAVSGSSGELKAYKPPGLSPTHAFTPFGPGAPDVSVGAFTNDDGKTTLVVGAGPGSGSPVVKVYDTASGDLTGAFQPFGPSYVGGLSVAAGDVNGDGFVDVLVGATSMSSEVRLFDGATNFTLISAFEAFNKLPGGVTVALGKNDAGHANLIIGAGAGGGPQVKVFDFKTNDLLNNFFAFDPGYSGGVNVAYGHAAGHATIIVGQAAGGSQVKVFRLSDGSLLDGFEAFGRDYTGGVSVAGGLFAGRDAIIVGGGGQVSVLDTNRQTLLANFRPFATRGTTNGAFQAFDVNGDAIAVAGTFDVASVPEPGSWSLMILGLVGVGAALRRRRVIAT